VLIQALNITKIFKKGDTETLALDKVSFSIKKGEYVTVMGPSGSGKSTLMHIIGLLDIPTSGDYLLEDKQVNKLSKNELARIRNKKIGFVFQSFNLLSRATALENVMLPMIYGGISILERKKRASILLTNIGLQDRLEHTSNQLSGGEMQRVAISRALAMNPEIIVADEPTGNIDSKQGAEIMNIFDTLNKAGHTIILITHDAEVARHAKRIIKLQDGKIVYDGKPVGTEI